MARPIRRLLVAWGRGQLEGDQAITRRNNSAFHDVLQLADVPRPVICLQGCQRFATHKAKRFFELLASPFDEMCREERNVRLPLSQRGKSNWKNTQSII